MQKHTQKSRALEAYLVAAARTGDQQALDRLVRLVGPRLMAHATRLLGDREAARDVVQTAWVDILTALPKLQHIGAFRSFALQIVTRKVARTIKGLVQDRVLAAEMPVPEDTAPLGEQTADAGTVREAIDTLPKVQRATLALFYLEDMTVTEVAHALDVPIGTVKTRLMHARARLRATLKGDIDDKD